MNTRVCVCVCVLALTSQSWWSCDLYPDSLKFRANELKKASSIHMKEWPRADANKRRRNDKHFDTLG